MRDYGIKSKEKVMEMMELGMDMVMTIEGVTVVSWKVKRRGGRKKVAIFVIMELTHSN